MNKTEHDWRRLDAMTAEQRHAAALLDPDARPLDVDRDRTKQTPRVKIVCRALGFTQEEFAARFMIPIGTLRDWEQGRVQPDRPVRAYLKVIAVDAAAVQRVLEGGPALVGQRRACSRASVIDRLPSFMSGNLCASVVIFGGAQSWRCQWGSDRIISRQRHIDAGARAAMNLIPLNDETRAFAESLVWFESSGVAPPRPIQPASWPIPSFDWWLIDEGGGEIVGASLPVDIFNDIDKLEIIDPEMEDSDE